MKRQLFAPSAGLLAVFLGLWCGAAPAPPAARPKLRVTLPGHGFSINALAFSPDGNTLASASHGDTEIRLWDVRRGKGLAVLKGHGAAPGRWPRGYVDALAFSPDGKTLASGSEDGIIKLWDVLTRTNTATLPNQNGTRLLRFSPDGKTLFADGRFYRLIDVKAKTARVVLKNYKGGKPAVAFDPKGKLLVAGAQNPYPYLSFALWDGDTDERVATYQGHTKSVINITFSGDCKIVASAGRDHSIRLWETSTGKNIHTIRDHPGRVCSLAFSPDGTILASGYKHQQADGQTDKKPNTGSVRLTEVSTGRLLATLEGKPGPIGPLTFSPDGKILAAASFDATIMLWELPRRYAMDKENDPAKRKEGTR